MSRESSYGDSADIKVIYIVHKISYNKVSLKEVSYGHEVSYNKVSPKEVNVKM